MNVQYGQRAVALNVAELATPVTLAVAMFVPATAPRVHVTEAWPCAFVVDVGDENVPAPAVAAHETATPVIGLLD
jgi:hypothetical protein